MHISDDIHVEPQDFPGRTYPEMSYAWILRDASSGRVLFGVILLTNPISRAAAYEISDAVMRKGPPPKQQMKIESGNLQVYEALLRNQVTMSLRMMIIMY